MLIKLEYLNKKYDLKIKGILHVGAHFCQELEDYLKLNVKKNKIIWIEAISDLVEEMRNRDKDLKIYNLLITDIDNKDYKFNLASSGGLSSSILDLGTHKINHPEVYYYTSRILKSKRLDTFYREENIEENFANFLNLDIQGVELLALKSLGKILNNFDYIYSEVNNEEVYKNCSLINELDEYLEIHGFKRVETYFTGAGWGDSFWIKDTIL